MPIKLSREMQLTRGEFLRELPKAIGNLNHQVAGDKVIITDGDRRLEIRLVDEGTLDVGSLHLPMEEVDFEFMGYTQEETDAFMARFDHHTQRTGG